MILEIDIIKYVPPGIGLGYYHQKPVFVSHALPGERVIATVQKETSSYYQAFLKKVCVASSDRIIPACPHYLSCGACNLMHLNYQQQLFWKKKLLQDILSQHALKVVTEIIPAPTFENYRYRTRLHYNGQTLGFKSIDQTQIINLNHCRILSLSILQQLPDLKKLLKKQSSPCELMVLASSQQSKIAVSLKSHQHVYEISGIDQCIEENYGWGTILLSSAEFAQSNPFVTNQLIHAVLDASKDAQQVVELYCGAGTFSLPLARQLKSLCSYDNNMTTIGLAEKSARKWDLQNCQFAVIPAEKVSLHDHVDTVLVDPPRAGLSKSVLKKLQLFPWKRLLYVSCNPATLARDLACLTTDSSVQLLQVTGFDMYSQTTHLEALAVLERLK